MKLDRSNWSKVTLETLKNATLHRPCLVQSIVIAAAMTDKKGGSVSMANTDWIEIFRTE